MWRRLALQLRTPTLKSLQRQKVLCKHFPGVSPTQQWSRSQSRHLKGWQVSSWRGGVFPAPHPWMGNLTVWVRDWSDVSRSSVEDPTIRTGKARPHSSGKGRGGQRISTTDRDFRFFPMPWLDKSFKSFTCHPPISLPCIDTDHVARNDCFHFKLSLIRKASRMIILSQYQTQI